MKRALRPDVQLLLEHLDSNPFLIESHAPEDARAYFSEAVRLADLPMPTMGVVRPLSIPGPQGPIPALLIDRLHARDSSAVVVWFHGGGFVTGGTDTHASFAATVSEQLDLPVVLVGYRLAPEARYPAAVVDAESATRWIASSPADLGFVVESLVLGGDSAGGTLAAVVALSLRDTPAKLPVDAQLLIYPASDFTQSYPSQDAFATGHLLTRAALSWYRNHYAPNVYETNASPLLADLHGLPPTIILTAELDPVRDEGRAYASKLIQCGIETVFMEAAGMIHGFVVLRKVLPSVKLDINKLLTVTRDLIDVRRSR